MKRDELFTLTEVENSADEREILESLKAFNRAAAGDAQYLPLTLARRAGDGALLGGLNGKTAWRWLYVNLLWVREDQRGTGLGSELLRRAEAEARQRGCVGAHLLTGSFQAPGFYEKQGYSLFGKLEGYPPPDHANYFYFKRWG